MKGGKSRRFKTSLLVGALSASVKYKSHVSLCISSHFWTLDAFVLPYGSWFNSQKLILMFKWDFREGNGFLREYFCAIDRAVVYISSWCYMSNCHTVLSAAFSYLRGTNGVCAWDETIPFSEFSVFFSNAFFSLK